MKPNNEQIKLIKEGIIDKLIGWYTDKQYWKAKKMFEDDPELQEISKRLFASIEKSSKMIEDYCKKYGCVEPTKHTIKLEKLKDMKPSKKRK
jgi:hypothetical protein